ncbi:MAG TPA: TonB-dependent receptor [Vicinamibacterales bacterium]|nr:TonB-dependent receptor [Vicinamibacterales bacterium]
MKCRIVLFLLVATMATAGPAWAQGGTTSTLAGVVVDSAGGVVPGADVQIKHNATGVTRSAVSNSQGAFSFPGLNIGTYTVTVTLQGFKTFVANDVVLTAGSPADVRAVLEVGGIEEQVVVSSQSEIVQTQSTVISSTINANQIVKLPLTSRGALDFVTLLPGVTTVAGNRQSQINGLPRAAINITFDGVNVQDNTLRSTDGFFVIVQPRLDAIEEVTVTTATQGAESAQGGVQIKFVTRSGTNDFSGSGYHYYRSDKLNANTWINNRNGVDKIPLKQNQFGSRVGGPIVIPGLVDGRNKAFFFVNYEEFRQPGAVTRTRTFLNPDAAQGIFRYSGGEVNLLTLAGNAGQTNTIDPTIAALLSDIRAATTTTGSVEDLDENLQRLRYNVNTESLRRYPTVRIDYNITEKHRFSSAYNYNYFTDFPDTLNNRDATFPGFPVEAGQTSERILFSNSLRSTMTSNLVNEARVGYSGSPVTFFKEFSTDMLTGSLVNSKGFHVAFPTVNSALTSPTQNLTPSSRNASNILIEDTVTWLKGKHSLSTGGSWTQYSLWLKNQTLAPTLSFGVITGDPAATLFTGTNFPGASNTNITAAQNLYALLTGRVTQIAGNAGLNEGTNEYEYLGLRTQRSRMNEAGFFVQDSWRVRPDLTLNLGLRYELQFPFYPLNDSYSTPTLASFCGVSGTNPQTVCNLFQAGSLPGQASEFYNFGKGTAAYDTDWNNLAPSVGLAWTLHGSQGPFGLVFGRQEGDSVLRAGYTRAYSREGMANFTNRFGNNPGVTITATRSQALGNLGTLPVLYREDASLGAPPFPATPEYPLRSPITDSTNIFDPGIQVPYADSWTVGLQRSLGRNTAVEVRYVGTRSRESWATLNYNEINIFDNGFINEFRQAQANLQANLLAGRPASFAYTGVPGTAPLPTVYAYFHGTAGNVNDPASYTSSNFTNNTFLNPLATFNPNPFSFASNLYDNATRRTNATNAGIPINFFLANPAQQGGAQLTTNIGKSDYHSLQLELRRRLANGLQVNSSYVFGNMKVSQWETHRRPIFMVRDAGDPGDITHVFKLNAIYELPFGQGRRFGGNVNGAMDRVIGGWSVALVSRIQSGRLVDLGNVRLVGMTAKDVHNMFKLRIDDTGKRIWMLPEDVINETIKAFSVSPSSLTGYGSSGPPSGRYFAPANGPDCIEVDNGADYGECAGRSLVVTGPTFHQHDVSITKRINIVGRINFEFHAEMLNAFNNHNFVPVGGIGSTLANYEVTAVTGTNQARVIQLVSRINW